MYQKSNFSCQTHTKIGHSKTNLELFLIHQIAVAIGMRHYKGTTATVVEGMDALTVY